MLRTSYSARRMNDLITLTKSTGAVDSFGHPSIDSTVKVLDMYAEVRQMSATKTMLTFQQADVVGVDIYMRKPAADFDGITWRGHQIHFPTPEDVDNRGMYLRVSGWYQVDNPDV